MLDFLTGFTFGLTSFFIWPLDTKPQDQWCGITEQYMTFTDRKGFSTDAHLVKLNNNGTNTAHLCINWRPYLKPTAASPQKFHKLCATWSLFYYASLWKSIAAKQDTNSSLPVEILKLGLKKRNVKLLGQRGAIFLACRWAGRGWGGGSFRSGCFRNEVCASKTLDFNIHLTPLVNTNSPSLYTGSFFLQFTFLTRSALNSLFVWSNCYSSVP